MKLNFEEICGAEPRDEDKPFLDRAGVQTSELTTLQRLWYENGYVVLSSFLPPDLIEAYSALRSGLNRAGGWSCPVPYMYFDQIKDLSLYSDLMDVLKHLLGSEMGLHLNLTGWVSTERNWHQDDYLNPDFVNSHYAAVWMALDDIHADSGPFEFVPGSHRWPLTRRDLVCARLGVSPHDADWPTKTQDAVSHAFCAEIGRRGERTQKFMAKKGDVLIWHGRLCHRGSVPRQPGLQRKALISHYSSLEIRSDMPERRQHTNGRWYFVHNNPLDQ